MASPIRLSVLMPVYNERYRVEAAITQVLEAPLPEGVESRLIIVDDGSKDGTREILRRIAAANPERITLIEHVKNAGKGAAIRTAIQAAEGDFAIIQDADLEYDPQDYPAMLAPLLSGEADAVYGSRYAARPARRVLAYWHTQINQFLTLLSNFASNQHLTDMETGYKAYRLDLLKSIPLRCDRFGIEPELVLKAAKRGLAVVEVPIAYHGRTYAEGKKITAWDGVKAIWTIFRFWLSDDLYETGSAQNARHTLEKSKRTADWLASTIRPFVGSRVLELASGHGQLTARILPRDHYTAAESDALALRSLHHRYHRNARVDLKPSTRNAIDASFPKGEFDTVLCVNTLERAEDDAGTLRNIYQTLAPGGRAVLVVPQDEKLFGSLDRALGHQRRYEPATLSQLAEDAGFELERMEDFNRAGAIFWWWNSVICKRTKPGAISRAFFDRFTWLARRVEKLLPRKGSTLIAVVKKPIAMPATLPLRKAA